MNGFVFGMAATLCARFRGAEDSFFPVARYVVLWIILSLVIVATIFDLRTREVPDWIALAILACAVSGDGLRLE